VRFRRATQNYVSLSQPVHHADHTMTLFVNITEQVFWCSLLIIRLREFTSTVPNNGVSRQVND